MKIRLLPATSRWGKKMEKVYSNQELVAITKMFIEGLGIKVEKVIIQ